MMYNEYMNTKYKQKRPVIDKDLAQLIQDYANANNNGNFTKAVDFLIRDFLLSWQAGKIKQ